MDAELTSLLADHLGLNLDELKRERAAKIAAEEAEKRRLQQEREAATEALKQENRRKKFAEFLGLHMVRAWVSSSSKEALVEIHSMKDLACPKCGEVPPRLDQLIVAYGDTLNGVGMLQRGNYDGRILGYSDHAILFVPAFRKTITCSCGETFVVAASYLPVADE